MSFQIGDSVPADFPGVRPLLAKPKDLHRLERVVNSRRRGFKR